MRFSHQPIAEAEVDMTSMLDIVFIMLIFFIVTSSFVKESAISLTRPSTGKPTTTSVANTVLITLQSNGEVRVSERAIDVRRIPAWIESQRRDNAELSVIVQAHSDASTNDLIGVVDQLKSAGVTKLSVATFE